MHRPGAQQPLCGDSKANSKMKKLHLCASVCTGIM